MTDADMRDGSTDALFDHMAELVESLPRMRELDGELKRAHAAQKVMGAQHELATCEAMLAEADAAIAEQEAALDEALRAGDDAVVDAHRRGMIYFSQQRGLRVGPVNNARAALEEALRAGGFSDTEEAASALLSRERCDQIDRELGEYRDDYEATLAACQAVEEVVDGDCERQA